MERKEDMQHKYNQAIYKLYKLMDENKELEEQLDWADKQLNSMADRTYKLEDYIHELNEKIIRLIMEG